MRLLVCLLLIAGSSTLSGQTTSASEPSNIKTVTCSIRTVSEEWRSTRPAIVYITVASVFDTPLNIPLWSSLSLDPLSNNGSFSIQLKNAGKISAGVDPRALETLEPLSSVDPRDEKRDKLIGLRFDHKNDKANFKLDARDLVWDYEVVSRPPVAKLFSIAKPGVYEAQFHMWWDSGSCESSKVRLVILPEGNKP
jgi:hypothetical protein